MPRYVWGLLLLAFVAGAGMSAIIFLRALQTPAAKIEEAYFSPEPVLETPEPPKQKEERDDSENRYGDPATCPALLNAQSYERDEDYMFMLPGRAPWVFRTGQDLQMAFEIEDKDITLYQRFVKTLERRGTKLVLAYIPTRAMLAFENLPQDNEISDDYDPQSARQNYDALIEKMRAQGVPMVGASMAESGAAFFNHADQHWTTKGARDMAKALAAYVREASLVQDLPIQKFETTEGEDVTYDGRFGVFIKKICGFRPEPEKDKAVRTDRVDADEAALLGEAAVPSVVLVGTSNSIRDEFKSNFDGYLKEFLQTDVLNAAISGGGMDDALVAYLSSPSYAEHPPKLLIWELPGYYDLGGQGMAAALRQAIPAALGECQAPLERLEKTTVEGKKVPLFEDLAAQNIGAEQAYLVLKFDSDVTKDFSVSIKTTDKKNQNFKFRKRREGNGHVFFYLPRGEAAMLDSITLNVSKAIDGKAVEASLCPVPGE